MIPQKERLRLRTPKDHEEFKDWLEALRSGKYEQGVGSLYEDGKYCCLGVACEELAVTSRRLLEAYGLPSGLAGAAKYVPGWLVEIESMAIMEKVKASHPTSLVNINDQQQATFDEIADYLDLLYRAQYEDNN